MKIAVRTKLSQMTVAEPNSSCTLLGTVSELGDAGEDLRRFLPSAELLQELGQVQDGAECVLVLGAVDRPTLLELFAEDSEELLGLLQLAHRLQQAGQVVHAAHRIRVGVAKTRPPARQCLSMQRLGVVIAAPSLQQPSQIVHRTQRLRVLFTKFDPFEPPVPACTAARLPHSGPEPSAAQPS